MFVLLAVLLAFLAQNLLTPSAYDFSGVTVCIAILGAVLFARHQGRTVRLSTRQALLLALLIVLVIFAWQVIPAGFAAGLFFLIAGGLFVHQTQETDAETYRSPNLSPKRQALIIAVVMLASAVLCIYDNEHIQPGLHGDEAESGIEARNINAGKYNTLIGVGWYDQPLPSFLVQAIGLRLFGDSVSGLRTTSAVVSLLTLPLVYLLARKLFGDRVALIALVLMACAHWFIAYARLGINYNQTTLLEVLAVLAFWHGWQTQKMRWFLLSGLATGAGLYLYFASRLVPILLIAFAAYLFYWQRTGQARAPRLRGQHIALWLGALVIIFDPMGLFFLDHAKEFNSRASFVFLFSDSPINTREQKLKIYTGSEDVPTALAVQVYRYATLFNVGGARDGQYGNTLPLVEYYTAVFFVLGLAYALYHTPQPRYMLLLLWLALTVLVGGVLTIESPFTPRLVGLMPVPFMLAAVTLDQVWKKLEIGDWRLDISNSASRSTRLARRLVRWSPYLVGALLLAAISYSNYWSYFDHYIHSIDGWAQREPATTVAKYAAQMQSDQTLYVMSAPELFVWHGTIRFLAPHVRGFDLLDPEKDLPIRDPHTQRASFVMLPNHTLWLDQLRALYPHGEVKEWRRPWGELWFIIYEAPADDIAAARQNPHTG